MPTLKDGAAEITEVSFIDERGSFSVISPYPGPLPKVLVSVKRQPARVALNGDIVPLKDEKVKLAEECLRETSSSELKAIKESSYSVTGIFNTSNLGSTSRSQNLQDLLDSDNHYMVCKFNLSSCTYIDGGRSSHEVDLEYIEASKHLFL